MSNLQTAQALAEQGDIEGSWNIVKRLMEYEPNDPHLLISASYLMQKADNWPVSYHLAKASTVAMPNRPEPWINLSCCCDQMYLKEEGIKAAQRAVQLSDTPALRASSLMNLASVMINNGMYEKAEPITRQALELNPESRKSMGNLGMALLAQGKWQEGWQNYAQCLGLNERQRIDYGLPDWNGEEGRVIVYGEQGLGDEISFASMLHDLNYFEHKFSPNKYQFVIDCDYRLKGLFKRSFYRLEVNGGRWKETYSGQADYQCAIGDLGKVLRNSDKDFHREKYLIADHIRRAQWEYLKETTGKPLIGIAWTGGASHTNAKARKLTKAQLQAITQGIDAHFVSLEYKPREAVPNIDVYPHATLTKDYDDTAALVAECDLVICIQTAVAHLAGALGVPCMVLVPEASQWRYHPKEMLWYGENFHVYKAPWNLSKVIEDAKHHL